MARWTVAMNWPTNWLPPYLTDMMQEQYQAAIEKHPWPAFIPDGAELIFLGTFPPPRNRWGMDFFYPNRTNDFWKVMGLIFYGSVTALYDTDTREFRLPEIKELLRSRHIAMGDTAAEVRRLRGNASDKFLEIVCPIDLDALVASAPALKAIATTGEKAASVVAGLTGTVVPAVGHYEQWQSADGRVLRLYRMPSTSRAYPLPVGQKAEYYRQMFNELGI